MKAEIKKEQVELDLSSAFEQEKLSDLPEERTETTESPAAESLDEAVEDPVSQSTEHYVERPRIHRILAWTLFGLVVIGIILYYLWLSGVLK